MTKKLLIIGIMGAIAGTATLGYLLFIKEPPLGKTKIPVDLILKAPKEKLWKSETVDDIRCDDAEIPNCENLGQIKEYWYAEEEEFVAQEFYGLQEDISKRTHNAQVFPNGDTNVGIFGVGVQRVKEKATGKWFNVAPSATTTIEAFEEQTKISFSEKIINQVYATESTFTPDPHVEGQSVDGFVWAYQVPGNTWNDVHDSGDGGLGGGVDNTANDVRVARVAYFTGAVGYIIQRGFFLFETGDVIPAGSDIASSTFHLYIDAVVENDSDAQAYVNIVQSSPASDTALVTGDFDQCGDIDNPDQGATAITFGNLVADSYNHWVLNATGMGWIGTGTGSLTKLGTREGHDIEDLASTQTDSVQNRIDVSMSEQAGAEVPKLVVEWSEAAAGGVYDQTQSSVIWWDR